MVYRRYTIFMINYAAHDVFVGTPLGTSDHCFVSCVLRVGQSVPVWALNSGTCRFNDILITLIIIFIVKLIQIKVARINVWARHDLFYYSVTEG